MSDFIACLAFLVLLVLSIQLFRDAGRERKQLIAWRSDLLKALNSIAESLSNYRQ